MRAIWILKNEGFKKKKEKMVHGVVGLVEDDQIISSKVRETFHSNF